MGIFQKYFTLSIRFHSWQYISMGSLVPTLWWNYYLPLITASNIQYPATVHTGLHVQHRRNAKGLAQDF